MHLFWWFDSLENRYCVYVLCKQCGHVLCGECRYSLLPVVEASSNDDKARRPPYVAAMAACDSLNAGQFMLVIHKTQTIDFSEEAF
eukprot:COSAG02_NODE_538_length_20609_cov_7.009703_3_plen_86_part_00